MSGGRLCPRCSTLIESSSAVFCYTCGQEMPNSSFSQTLTVAEAPTEKQIRPTKKFLSRRFFLVFFTLLVSLGFFILLLFSRFKSVNHSPNILKPTANDFVSTVSALPQATINFGKDTYTSLTPAATKLYLEGGSLKNFLAKFLDGASQRLLEERLGLTLEETVSFFDPSFAFIKSASGSALLAQSRDREFVKSRITKMQKDGGLKNLQIDLLGEVLVVSDSLNFLNDIRAASQKTQLSLSMTAQFLETLKKLPRQGQLLIYSSDIESVYLTLKIFFGPNLENALNSLRGTSFVISSRSGSVVLVGIHD